MSHEAPSEGNQKSSVLQSESGDSRQTTLAMQRSEQALRLVAVSMPWLSPLVYRVKIFVDDRVTTAAVSRSGRIWINSNVFSTIPLREATYVLAHELLHLALDTFSRETDFDDPETVNIAHDYIINDLLRTEMHMDPPLGGLDLLGAAEWSLEKMVVWMKGDGANEPRVCWTLCEPQQPITSSLGTMGQALRDAGLLPKLVLTNSTVTCGPQSLKPGLDVIFPSQEGDMFAGEKPTDPSSVEAIRRVARQSLALKEAALAAQVFQGTAPGDISCYLQAVRSHCQPPWQIALQRWMETTAPSTRHYAYPSRRGADRTDCVLPGKKREGWTLHIVLDTSDSMSDCLAQCLGEIADFCESANLAEVHIVQCDTEVTMDEWVPVNSLEHFKIDGFGGSNMSAAMLHLASDPEVTAMIVITDGCIAYPDHLPNIDVLWVITHGGHFIPRYGTVLRLKST